MKFSIYQNRSWSWPYETLRGTSIWEFCMIDKILLLAQQGNNYWVLATSFLFNGKYSGRKPPTRGWAEISISPKTWKPGENKLLSGQNFSNFNDFLRYLKHYWAISGTIYEKNLHHVLILLSFDQFHSTGFFAAKIYTQNTAKTRQNQLCWEIGRCGRNKHYWPEYSPLFLLSKNHSEKLYLSYHVSYGLVPNLWPWPRIRI